MAYSVDDIGSVIAFLAASYAADDGAQDADSTTCMKNGTTSEDCDEWKEGTINGKIEITLPPASLTALSVRFYLNSIMNAGDNALLPYTDGNSVSTTNEVISTYDTAGQWVEHVCSAAFIAELADISGSCFVRLSASDGAAKSKIGEVNVDAVQTLHTLAGITRDNDETALGSCEFTIQRRDSLDPEIWSISFAGTSNSSTGAFTHEIAVGTYRIVSIKDVEPQVMDVGPPLFVCEALASNDTFTTGALHGLVNDDQVEIWQAGAEALPVGVSEGTTYHIVQQSGATFKLSTTQGGSAVNITVDGAGIISGLPATS